MRRTQTADSPLSASTGLRGAMLSVRLSASDVPGIGNKAAALQGSVALASSSTAAQSGFAATLARGQQTRDSAADTADGTRAVDTPTRAGHLGERSHKIPVAEAGAASSPALPALSMPLLPVAMTTAPPAAEPLPPEPSSNNPQVTGNATAGVSGGTNATVATGAMQVALPDMSALPEASASSQLSSFTGNAPADAASQADPAPSAAEIIASATQLISRTPEVSITATAMPSIGFASVVSARAQDNAAEDQPVTLRGSALTPGASSVIPEPVRQDAVADGTPVMPAQLWGAAMQPLQPAIEHNLPKPDTHVQSTDVAAKASVYDPATTPVDRLMQTASTNAALTGAPRLAGEPTWSALPGAPTEMPVAGGGSTSGSSQPGSDPDSGRSGGPAGKKGQPGGEAISIDAARFGMAGWIASAQPNTAGSATGATTRSQVATEGGMAQLALERVASDSSARRVSNVLQSDLALGVQTDAFGHVRIQTSMLGGQLAAQISLEHAHAGTAALAAQMPVLEARLGEKYGLDTSVSVRADASLSAGGGQSPSQGEGGRQPTGSYAAAPFHSAGAHTRVAEVQVATPWSSPISSGRLDVTI